MSMSYDPAELRVLAVSETGFVFDPRTGHSYSLNPTGLAVLGALRDGTDLATVAVKLREEFDGGVAVEDDIEGFLELLRELGLVARSGK
jgi:PqqD family protein of HPr-rel-A system